MRPGILGLRVGIVDNDGILYYAKVKDAVVFEPGELYIRGEYDTIRDEEQVDDSVS